MEFETIRHLLLIDLNSVKNVPCFAVRVCQIDGRDGVSSYPIWVLSRRSKMKLRDSHFEQAMPSDENQREPLNYRHSSLSSCVLWWVVTFVFFLTQMFVFLSRNVMYKYTRPSLLVRLLACSLSAW